MGGTPSSDILSCEACDDRLFKEGSYTGGVTEPTIPPAFVNSSTTGLWPPPQDAFSFA